MKKLVCFILPLFIFSSIISCSTDSSINKNVLQYNFNSFHLINEFLNADLRDILLLSAEQIGIYAEEIELPMEFSINLPEMPYELKKSISSILCAMEYVSSNEALNVNVEKMMDVMDNAKEIIYRIIGKGYEIGKGEMKIKEMSNVEKLRYFVDKWYEEETMFMRHHMVVVRQ